MAINRLLALTFVAIWMFPVYWLLDLPHERALNYSRGLEQLLRNTAKDDELAEKHLPSYAPQLRQARDEAAAIAANPALIEPAMQRLWFFQVGSLVVGAVGAASLWRRPPFWRIGVFAGVAAFVVVCNLYYVPNLLWMTRGSLESTLKVLHLWTNSPSTIVTHFVAPFILVAVAGYALLQRDRRTSGGV